MLNKKKYTRSSTSVRNVPTGENYITRLNTLVTEPEVIETGDIEATRNDVFDINSNDSTISTIEYELSFLSRTLENINSLKKSEKYLKRRFTLLTRCLNQLKDIRQAVSQVGLILTPVPEQTIINSIEENIPTVEDSNNVEDNNLGKVTLTENENSTITDTTSTRLKDFE